MDIFAKSRAMSLSTCRTTTRTRGGPVFSVAAASWLASAGGTRRDGRLVPDSHAARLAVGAGSRQYRDRCGLSDAIYAYRTSRHDRVRGRLSRAYNDYLYDRFLRQEKRLKGIAVLPLQDIPVAVAELRRAVKELGIVGGLLPADGLPRPLGHPEFHPLYEEANRLGCMLAVHSQNSLRNNDLFMWRHEAATLAHVWPQMRQFTNLTFSGVFGKYPDLRIAFLEAGCGWVPYLMSKMEARIGELPRPSKLIERGQMYFQCGEEMTTSRDLELLGDECLFWASDFPHEGIVDMSKAVNEFLSREDIPETSKRKISYDNPKRLYGL